MSSSKGVCPHTLPSNGMRPGVSWCMLAMNMMMKPSRAMATEPIAKEWCIWVGGGKVAGKWWEISGFCVFWVSIMHLNAACGHS